MACAEEIIRQMNILDGSYPDYRFMTDDVKSLRMLSAVDALSEFSAEVIKEAHKDLIESGTEKLPSIGEVYKACQEAEIDLVIKRAPKPRVAKGNPVKHKCSPPPGPCKALTYVKLFFPYEATHARCPGEIQATCPGCGKRFGPVVSDVLQSVKNMFPDQTKDWNLLHKGFLLCAECDPTFKENSGFPTT